MLYVFRHLPSDSARDLAEGMNLNCRKVRDLSRVHYGAGLRGGDRVICWGDSLSTSPDANIQVLNGGQIINKLQQAQVLREKGIPTIQVRTTLPPPETPVDPLIEAWRGVMREVGHPLDRAAIHLTLERLRAAEGLPLQIPITWLPRTLNHLGGRDLLTPPLNPAFWVKKEEIAREFRLHIFRGKSIRAGVKVHNTNSPTHHPWVRSLEGGWRISYDSFESSKAMRKIAKDAVAALSLDFGAVDLAQKADGGLMVLEVNRAPGLGDGTLNAYTQAIERWVEGEDE